MLDEQQWVTRAQAGDRDAFAALVERYWVRLQRWLSCLTHHTQAAEDLTQETFVKAWVGLRALRNAGQFAPWLYRIARNALVDWQRRTTFTGGLPNSLIGPDQEPAVHLVVDENKELFERACARLPPLFRAAFLLWTQEGFNQAQLAEALETTEETARWRVFKARQLLVKELRGALDQTKR
jgi:RNA polymerase sigma-70 factor (ECF subfamily)